MKDILSDEMHHPSNNVTNIPVLIVGAGPSGLVTAITLARYGIDTMLVERRTELSDEPRATAISVRSTELLRSWALDSEARAGAVDVSFRGHIGETLTGPGTEMILGYPTAAEAAAVSPVAPVCAPQDHLETVLLRRLRELNPARVRMSSELIDLAAGDRGALARVRDRLGGGVATIAARYVVGADGVRSRVRERLGVSTEAHGEVGDAISVLFRAPLWERLGDRRHVIYSVTHPEAEGAFVPSGRGDRWVYGFADQPGALPAGALEEATAAERIRTGAGIGDLDLRLERIGRFQFAANLAERFRVGSAFLVGDAAHRVTPRGGTGMNTAIRDGHDLGWKLAWVLKGWAGDELLDSYERERRPAAEHNVIRSVDPNGSLRPVDEELAIDLGGRILHAWVEPGRVSTVDLLGPGLTLFKRAGAATPDCAELAGDAPVTVRGLPPGVAEDLGIAGGESVLVRPDGLPAGRCAGEAVEPLEALG